MKSFTCQKYVASNNKYGLGMENIGKMCMKKYTGLHRCSWSFFAKTRWWWHPTAPRPPRGHTSIGSHFKHNPVLSWLKSYFFQKSIKNFFRIWRFFNNYCTGSKITVFRLYWSLSVCTVLVIVFSKFWPKNSPLVLYCLVRY